MRYESGVTSLSWIPSEAVDRPALTYRGLRRQVDRTVAALHRCGIGRGDPVGLVLPNGPEMATAFVASRSSARTDISRCSYFVSSILLCEMPRRL